LSNQENSKEYENPPGFPFSSLRKSGMSLSKFLQLRGSRLVFRLLPFSLARAFVEILGRLYFLVNREEKALILETIKRVFPEETAGNKLQKKIRDIFRGIFDHYHEKLFVGYAGLPGVLDFFRSQVEFQGLGELREALAAGRGVILVTGHFGAVEFLPGSLMVNGFPTSMICRFQTNYLREAQGRRAQGTEINLIEVDRGQGFWEAMKALKAGRLLIIECDEFERWRVDPQREVRFLGQRLGADRTLELFQRRSRSPVVMALVQREGRRRYSCRLTAVVCDDSPEQSSVGERCLEILADRVQSHPEQWYQWFEFGKMIQTHREVGYDHPEGGYLASEPAASLPD